MTSCAITANAVDAASTYVAISKARNAVALYTDSRAKLTEAVRLRDGAQVGAMDQDHARFHRESTHVNLD